MMLDAFECMAMISSVRSAMSVRDCGKWCQVGGMVLVLSVMSYIVSDVWGGGGGENCVR